MNIGYKFQCFSTYETVFHHTLPHGLCQYYIDESGTIIIIIINSTFVCCPNNKNLINSCSFGKTILTPNVEVKRLSEIMIWNTHPYTRCVPNPSRIIGLRPRSFLPFYTISHSKEKVDTRRVQECPLWFLALRSSKDNYGENNTCSKHGSRSNIRGSKSVS